jgi:hippurate hydrolase
MGLYDEALALAPELSKLRHSLHQEPEIGLDLPRTQATVLAALDGLPVEITLGRALSSVTAVLRGAHRGRTVLLRGDMDALPVTERTGLPYASEVDGAMHACGHDLHTAMLAGAARLLCARRGDLAGTVVFMFQPGEEGYAGAKHMIEEGVLDAAGERPAAAYALHVMSAELPIGVITSRSGPVLAAADRIEVTVHGQGGHAATPQHAADPIPVACEMVTALQTFVTRRFDVFDPVVITVGSFHAGTADNIIPDQARFLATIRSFSAEARTRVKDGVARMIREIAEAHGLTATTEHLDGYPVTIADQSEAAFAEHAVAALFGRERFDPQKYPMTGAEDFSFVLERVPGAFLFIGACPPDRVPATAPFNHSPEAVFDDAVLSDGTALYAELALRRLTRAEPPAGGFPAGAPDRKGAWR